MSALKVIVSILKWTCIVALCIIATPFIILALPEIIVCFAAGWALGSI